MTNTFHFSRSIALISALCFVFCASGQQVSAINYTTKIDLPSSQVYDIIQDDFGFLWFASDKGLSRYDGQKVINYSKKDGILDNVIFDFHKRPSGDIWCTTNSSKLFKIKTGSNPKFEAYEFNDTIQKYVKNLINCGIFFHDKAISIAYLHTEGFLTIEENGSVSSKPHLDFTFSSPTCHVVKKYGKPFFFWDNSGEYALKLNSKGVHVSSYTGHQISSSIESLDLGSFQIYASENSVVWVYPNSVRKDIKNSTPIASGFLSEGRFWIGYRYGGVELYNSQGNLIGHFLKNKSVTQLFEDHEKGFWISTLEHGVFKILKEKISLLNETSGNKISAIESDEIGNIYLGYDDGSVFSRSVDGLISNLYKPESSSIPVKMLLTDQYLIFSSDQIMKYHIESKRSMFYDKLKTNYITAHHDGLIYGIGSSQLRTDDESSEKIIFNSKRMYDVTVFNKKIYGGNIDGLFLSAYPDSGKVQQLRKNIRVNNLNVMGDLLILGTNGEGIICLDKNHKERYSFTIDSGLNSNFISSTFSENDSVLWICSNQGVNRLVFHSNGTQSCNGISMSEGLLSNEVWAIHIKNDTAWVATQQGVNYFATSALDETKGKTQNYFLQWSKIRQNGHELPKNGELSYDQNELTFEFLGISFREDLSYRYKLVGLSKNWRYTTNRAVTFSALPPGEYTLLVDVKGENDRWASNQISFDFLIHKPFWNTWWFIVGVIFTSGLLIYWFFKVRILIYNRDLVREFLRYVLQKIRREKPSISIKHKGKQIKLSTNDIHFVKTDGNYLEIHTTSEKLMIRSTINHFIGTLPDKLEFIQVHRSYIVRIEHVQQKSSKELIVLETVIPVGRKFQDQIGLIKMT